MVGKFRGLLIPVRAEHAVPLHRHPARQQTLRGALARVELFLLRDGGVYPLLFWGGQVLLGTLAPLALLARMHGGRGDRGKLGLASLLFLIGGMAQIYVIIIGAQAYPLTIFPGFDVSSGFGDGAIASYVPTLPEALLGLAGVSLAMMLTALAFRLLPFLPQGVAARNGVCGMSRLYVSAISKSCGKTTLSLGMAAALSARAAEGLAVQEGADYIDPMWLGPRRRPHLLQSRLQHADARGDRRALRRRRRRRRSRAGGRQQGPARRRGHAGQGSPARRWPSCWARPWFSWSTRWAWGAAWRRCCSATGISTRTCPSPA